MVEVVQVAADGVTCIQWPGCAIRGIEVRGISGPLVDPPDGERDLTMDEYTNETRTKGFGVMQKVDQDEALLDIAAATESVSEAGKVGIVGFCFGGRLAYLQRAFALRPDAEIAAHLGEVLWHLGQREQAQKIWSDMLKEHPKNEALQNAIKRFIP